MLNKILTWVNDSNLCDLIGNRFQKEGYLVEKAKSYEEVQKKMNWFLPDVFLFEFQALKDPQKAQALLKKYHGKRKDAMVLVVVHNKNTQNVQIKALIDHQQTYPLQEPVDLEKLNQLIAQFAPQFLMENF